MAVTLVNWGLHRLGIYRRIVAPPRREGLSLVFVVPMSSIVLFLLSVMVVWLVGFSSYFVRPFLLAFGFGALLSGIGLSAAYYLSVFLAGLEDGILGRIGIAMFVIGNAISLVMAVRQA